MQEKENYEIKMQKYEIDINNYKMQLENKLQELENYKVQVQKYETDLNSYRKIILELEDKCKKDPMTNLYNKEQFKVIVNKQIEIAKEKHKPFSMIFVDIDNFKRFNTDNYILGDSIIEQMGSMLDHFSGDFVIRYGGDEFIIVSRIGTDIDGGYGFAQRIRREIEEYEFLGNDYSSPIRITVSCGVTAYDVNRVYHDDICKQLLFEASRACTQAKKIGKDGKAKNFVQVFGHTSN